MRYHASTEALIQTAARKARDLGHSYVGSAHLLLALTSEAGGMGLVLRQLGVEPELTEVLAQLLEILYNHELFYLLLLLLWHF